MKENTSEQVENQVAAEAPPTRGGVTQRAPSLLRAIDVLRPAQKVSTLLHQCFMLRNEKKVNGATSYGNLRFLHQFLSRWKYVYIWKPYDDISYAV